MKKRANTHRHLHPLGGHRRARVLLLLAVRAASLIFLSTCSPPAAKSPEAAQGRTPKPVSVIIQKASSGNESFQADVEVYSSSNRDLKGFKLTQKYRLSTKSLDGVVFTRIDFDPAFTGTGRARSVISNGREIVLFDPTTLEVQQRMAIPAETQDLVSRIPARAMPGHIDTAALRATAKRLSLDLYEDPGTHAMVLRTIPGADQSKLRITSPAILLDTSTDTIVGSQATVTDSSGNTVSMEQHYIYQPEGDQLVTVGEVDTVTSTPAQPAVTTGDPAAMDQTPVVNSADDIPAITDSEQADMESQGYTLAETEPFIGDPNNAGSTQTIVKEFDDVQVNTLDERLFRLPFFAAATGGVE